MTSPKPQYIYRAAVRRVVDSDSIIMDIDLGHHVTITRSVRLTGIDAPELNTATGQEARKATALWLSTPAPLVVRTELDRSDKYGRCLGEVFRDGDTVSLNTWLVSAGMAVVYDGGKR